jgi:hypothetical protein
VFEKNMLKRISGYSDRSSRVVHVEYLYEILSMRLEQGEMGGTRDKRGGNKK